MRLADLRITYAITGFFLGVLVPLFVPLLGSAFWRFGLMLMGLTGAFFLFMVLMDVVEFGIFNWIVRSARPDLPDTRPRPGPKASFRAFGIAFLLGLGAALIFSPTAVVRFLGRF